MKRPGGRPTLYLHVGTHKTGTSTVQSALHANRQRLAEAGILYPTDGVYCTPAGWAGPPPEGGHRYLAFSMMGTWPTWDPKDYTAPLVACREALEGDLARWRGRRGRMDAILSSEYWFRDVDPAGLRAFFDGLGYHIRVIVYLRRQDHFLESLYDQRVRAGSMTDPFEHFVERCLADPRAYPWYHHRLRRLAAVFGEANLIVRPFERGQLQGGDVLDDLLAVIGYGPPVDWHRPLHHNRSLPTELTEAIRVLVARLPPDTPARTRLRLSHHLRLGGWPPGTDPVRYARQTTVARRALVERFAADNAAVAREFLHRSDGRLFDAPVETSGPVWTGLTPEALARAGLFAWSRCAADAAAAPTAGAPLGGSGEVEPC
ncbi:MAG: hypothetical protein R3F65_12535 [bacterium]